MHLNLSYPCGCALSRMRENEPFVLVAACAEHGGDESLSSTAARGAAAEPTAAPCTCINVANECDVRKEGCRVKKRLINPPTGPQHGDKASLAAQTCEFLTDVGLLTRKQAPAGDVDHAVGDVVVSCYVWGRLQRLLETLKKACVEGDSEYSQIGAVQDLLWRCAHGRGVITQRVTADYFAPLRAVLAKWESNPDDLETMDEGMKMLRGFLCGTFPPRSNNERDSEWRSALREALKDCGAQWGADLSNVEIPTSGPAVFALAGMFLACHIEGRKQASKKISDAIYELAMGHKP